jgi:pyridoxamine 5'-phosphate oxidase
MSNWIEELKRDIHGELVIATLATVRSSVSGPEADARNVVVRQIDESGQLSVVSDARSQKNQQLKLNASAALVFWFPKLRKQFRIVGSIQILTGKETNPLRLQAWRELSDPARALFFWPHCGDLRQDGDEFVKAVPVDIAMPASFELLRLAPVAVQTLDLNPHPHLRMEWTLCGNAWQNKAVNP